MSIDSALFVIPKSRRAVLAGAFFGATASVLPMRAVAQVLMPGEADALVAPAPIDPPLPIDPPAPIDKVRLITLARQQLDRHASKIWLRDKVGVVDFSRPSRDPRLFIINMLTGDLQPYLVTHGKGSDPEHDGWLKTFSDAPGSLATSRGAYVTREYYEGKHGLSMRLLGLDVDNQSAEDRAIVVHGARYANPERIAEMGKLGRSEGCFALPEAKLVEVIARIGAGRLLFADKA
jgi:hypothetical protein